MIDDVSRPHPALYQMNTRVSLLELGASLGRADSLDDVPDATLDAIGAYISQDPTAVKVLEHNDPAPGR